MGIIRYRKEALAHGFRSKFEYDISKYLKEKGISYEYEKRKLKYTVPETIKSYTPDWQFADQSNVIYESKGRFTGIDRAKMLLVRESNPEITIRMIFQNSSVKISKNSKTTYAAWCDKNGIEWCDFRKGIPKIWLKK